MVRERLVVVVPGTSTLRWIGRHATAHPALVAVDSQGRSRCFGEQVLVAGQWDDCRLVGPFGAAEISSVRLTQEYMGWLLTSAPHAARRAATVLVVPVESQLAWRRIGDRMPGETVVLVRPVTVAAGLGLDVDSATAHLVVDVRDDGSEVAVVGSSTVIGARSSGDSNPEAIAALADELLMDLDPDLEYECRRRGAHAVGLRPDQAGQLAEMLQIPVRGMAGLDKVLAAGVLANRSLIDAYFGASRRRVAHGPRRTVRAS